jgi:hypothetical protein
MKIFFLLSLLLSPSIYSQIDELSWMLGKWKMETEKSFIFEEWTYSGGKTFEGTGTAVSKRGGDTLFTEYLTISRFGEEIFYIADVDENSYPVPFKLKAITSNQAVFENWTHDFPQLITYRLFEDGSLSAKVEGKKGSEKVTVDYLFKKVN